MTDMTYEELTGPGKRGALSPERIAVRALFPLVPGAVHAVQCEHSDPTSCRYRRAVLSEALRQRVAVYTRHDGDTLYFARALEDD